MTTKPGDSESTMTEANIRQCVCQTKWHFRTKGLMNTLLRSAPHPSWPLNSDLTSDLSISAECVGGAGQAEFG